MNFMAHIAPTTTIEIDIIINSNPMFLLLFHKAQVLIIKIASEEPIPSTEKGQVAL